MEAADFLCACKEFHKWRILVNAMWSSAVPRAFDPFLHEVEFNLLPRFSKKKKKKKKMGTFAKTGRTFFHLESLKNEISFNTTSDEFFLFCFFLFLLQLKPRNFKAVA